MTRISTRPATASIPAGDIIGPYSAWPRNSRKSKRLAAGAVAATGAATVFAHCLLPALI